MKQLIKTIKYIFYRFFPKRFLVIIIFSLLCCIFINNSVFAAITINPTNSTSNTLYAVYDIQTGMTQKQDLLANTFFSQCFNRYVKYNDTIFDEIIGWLENPNNGKNFYGTMEGGADYIDLIIYTPVAHSTNDTVFWSHGVFSFSLPSYKIEKNSAQITVFRYALATGGIYNIAPQDFYDLSYFFWCSRSKVFTYWRERYRDFKNENEFHNTLYSKLDALLSSAGNQTANNILSNIKSDTQNIKTNTQNINTNTETIKQNTANIEQNTQNIVQNTENINNNVSEIKDVIKDTNIDSNLPSNLPTDNTQDTTTSGVNNIFDFLKNAFTTGTAKDIVIPVPFTQKNFTIQANFLQNILSKTEFSWVYNIIQAFWWYVISVFIVKDISSKFTKIKGGDIENIQDNNIKEDML